MKSFNQKVSSIKESIFSKITSLANEHNAINLSQGFPDFDGPEFIRDAFQEALSVSKLGQYSPMPGLPFLQEEIKNYTKNLYDLNLNLNEITITNGATEGIFLTCMALLNDGDEVVIFEPFYDSYPAAISLTGAKLKVVTLEGPSFKWSPSSLESAFSKKTKLVILNNPHNPTGRVFDEFELKELAKLVIKYDCFVLSDEVYEFLTFDDHKHIPIMTLPGMRERTITISSAGKTFGHTGLKVGWTLAEPSISNAIRMVHQFNVFCVNTYSQFAVARGLQNLCSYLPTYRETYERKRLQLHNILKESGFSPKLPQGSYFSLVQIPTAKQELGFKDITFCEHLIAKNKIATIPPSVFYLNSKEGERYLRFCFAKKEETLAEAGKKLRVF